jgi:Lon protease-like protein
LSLKVFEARYVDMTAACLRDREPFGICPIRSGKEVGLPAQPAEVGTLAWIRAADVTQTGIFQLQVEGGSASWWRRPGWWPSSCAWAG